jgi:hypothetical protein
VPPGFLTPRGAELMRLMGRYYRVLYGGRGLVEASVCPPPNTVVAWTDVDQRTRLTGMALLAGMYPGCTNPLLRHQEDLTVPDPLFHPQPTASCPMDPAANRAAVLDRIGGNFDSVLREYAPELKLMQATLCPAGRTSAGAYCGLPSEPPAVQVGPRGWITISGPIAIGASAAETFLMESAEGMPPDQVAWGRLSGGAALQELLKIHRLEMDLAHKTPPIARQHGSNLLAQIAAGLQNGHAFPGLEKLAEPVRLGLLVGHETNIANVARLPAERGVARRRARVRAVAGATDRPALRAARLLRADPGADAPVEGARLRESARHDRGRPARLRERRPREGLPAGALRADRQRGDRSRLRDDQALAAIARSARPVSMQASKGMSRLSVPKARMAACRRS